MLPGGRRAALRRGQDSNLRGPSKGSDLEACSLVPDQPLRAPLLVPDSGDSRGRSREREWHGPLTRG
ncbi:hypothetical protein SGPA1_22093 [Streptomyces misionensis JCM 4497]